MIDYINMENTIAGSMNDNINMENTIAGSMIDNINMENTIAGSMIALLSKKVESVGILHVYVVIHFCDSMWSF
jgi:type III secretory pathway component EscV